MRFVAQALGDGAWTREAIADRLSRTLGDAPVDLARLSARLLFHFDSQLPPAPRDLTRFLSRESLLRPFLDNEHAQPLIITDPPVMGRPPDSLPALALPKIPTLKDLQIWLGLFPTELEWFADERRRQSKVTIPALHHYRYAWVRKASGDGRLIEKPKERLKSMQKQLLSEILARIPPHPRAHGFVRGRSIRSYVADHIGQPAVMRFDLKNFFTSVPVPRICRLFQTLGYPPRVASLITGLCTHEVSPALAGAPFADLPWKTRKQLTSPHLPQGAPTSPALANLSAWAMDCRLTGLAARFDLRYSRYADDLAFSGGAELRRLAPQLESLVGAIALEEGFALNHRKTRLRLASQRQKLAGVVVNACPNIPRSDYERLKATLHNCVRFGPASQNRRGHENFRSHLLGRIAHVGWLNPNRGKKLRQILEKIDWN
ncbi:MAG: reverse transcriptase family protein [Pseudomonadota bacterium]